MAYIEKFSSDETDLLVSLPYRAGIWVSLADRTGADKAEEQEVAALDTIMREKAQGLYESAFIHEVMAEAFAREERWQNWADDPGDVLADSRKAIALISERLGPQAVSAYRNNLLHIGVKIAKAFGEHQRDEALPVRFWTGTQQLIARLLGSPGGMASERVLNISYNEDIALSRLVHALGQESKKA